MFINEELSRVLKGSDPINQCVFEPYKFFAKRRTSSKQSNKQPNKPTGSTFNLH